MIKDIVFVIVDIIGIVIITTILAIGLYKYINKYNRLKRDYDLLREINSPINRSLLQATERDFYPVTYSAKITLSNTESQYEEDFKVAQL